MQLGFEKVKHFSSTKFQPGQQRGDSVLRPPHAPLIRRSGPSSSSFLPILHSQSLSEDLEGLSSLIYFKHCSQQFFVAVLESTIMGGLVFSRMTHGRGEEQKYKWQIKVKNWSLKQKPEPLTIRFYKISPIHSNTTNTLGVRITRGPVIRYDIITKCCTMLPCVAVLWLFF